MLTLRADPWSPEYGMGFDVDVDDTPASIDAGVESTEWSAPLVPIAAGAPGRVTFVDGVRRADVRLVADLDGRRAFGLFGTYAVGAVHCDGRASFGDCRIGRVVVLSSGVMPPSIEVRHGGCQLEFEPGSEASAEPDAPLLGLQGRMRQAEAQFASELADLGDGIVVCDGPLGFLDRRRSPVVGLSKRISRVYLDPERERLLPRLEPGQRTPLFGVAEPNGRIRLYSWYLRLAALRTPWHDHAGLVRCEVTAGVGIDAAIDIADRVALLLPTFAGRSSDPRAPQNLAPISGLETFLRHRMGDPLLIRRALLNYLCTVAA